MRFAVAIALLFAGLGCGRFGRIAFTGSATDDTAGGTGDPDDTAVPLDEDGDGYDQGEDCDDGDASVHPGAEEGCNDRDDDCDGDADEGVQTTWYADADEDGWGDDATATSSCEVPTGGVPLGGDCDDTDPAYHPGATEDDCTDPNDYNCDGSTGYADADADGWPACEDCDDGDATVNPDGVEDCDGVDDDCDGAVDEDAVDAPTWYADGDADGYGDPDLAEEACEQPAGTSGVGTDCDDTDAAVNPGARETCNDVDDDCDGSVDEGATDASTWYEDGDSDGYGDPSSSKKACDRPAGYVANAADCDDTDAGVNPGATEFPSENARSGASGRSPVSWPPLRQAPCLRNRGISARTSTAFGPG